jgi:hypothetical protein
MNKEFDTFEGTSSSISLLSRLLTLILKVDIWSDLIGGNQANENSFIAELGVLFIWAYGAAPFLIKTGGTNHYTTNSPVIAWKKVLSTLAFVTSVWINHFGILFVHDIVLEERNELQFLIVQEFFVLTQSFEVISRVQLYQFFEMLNSIVTITGFILIAE